VSLLAIGFSVSWAFVASPIFLFSIPFCGKTEVDGGGRGRSGGGSVLKRSANLYCSLTIRFCEALSSGNYVAKRVDGAGPE